MVLIGLQRIKPEGIIHQRRRSKMIIQCTFSMPLKNLGDYAWQIAERPPLPEYITKKGPYIDDAVGAGKQTVTLYEFDESEFPEGWKRIFEHLDVFRGVPGFTFSAQVLETGYV
jgi:hypothetical protein